MSQPAAPHRDPALSAAMDAAVAAAGGVTAARPELIAILKRRLAEGRAETRGRVESRALTGMGAAHGAAVLVDALVLEAHALALAHALPGGMPAANAVALVAVGGYGRGEMAPFSDVDLLFLTTPKPSAKTLKALEFVLYLLWDLGLKVGHATRTVDDCVKAAKADLTIRTALLEARFLAGERAPYEQFRARFHGEIVATTGPHYLTQKLAERDERHTRLGDSRYLLEPNIKEGKGGLRDLQTLYWIAKYLYRVESVSELVALGVLSAAETRRFERAQTLLWTVRFYLHTLAGRAEERLTFDMQDEIARRMGYRNRAGVRGVERLMKHYYVVAKTVGNLTGIFCAALEAQHKKKPLLSLAGRKKDVAGFPLEAGRLAVAAPDLFKRQPVEMLRLFHASLEHGIEIHPRALWRVTQSLAAVDAKLLADAEANRLFLATLTSRNDPESTLRRMNESGLFGRFVPDFGRVVGQMQHDMYHVYTVDEHTVFALGILARIERGQLKEDHPVASEIIHKVQSRRALYLGLLCHDIAKGRGGDHSELGAVVAQKLARRMGLSPEEVETVSWLVLHHLAMSRTAFKRDLSDPQTIADFIALVQSPERLKLLFCLTVCDIRAVGPSVWNNWKATLLQELYWAAEEAMGAAAPGMLRTDRVKAAQDALKARLKTWSEADIAAHLARGYPAYWLAFDVDTLARHVEQVRAAERAKEPLSVVTRVVKERAVTEVTVYAGDHPGLFARIAGALAAASANIVDARIFTTPQGMALDTLWIQDLSGAAFAEPHKLARLKRGIEDTLSGKVRTHQAIAERRRAAPRSEAFHVETRVIVNNQASGTHTVIEINARDRPGLLYDVTRALAAEGLQISTAKIATYGQRAVDVFYLRDAFGMKVESEAKLARVREKLIAVMAPSAAKPSRGTGDAPAVAE